MKSDRDENDPFFWCDGSPVLVKNMSAQVSRTVYGSAVRLQCYGTSTIFCLAKSRRQLVHHQPAVTGTAALTALSSFQLEVQHEHEPVIEINSNCVPVYSPYVLA